LSLNQLFRLSVFDLLSFSWLRMAACCARAALAVSSKVAGRKRRLTLSSIKFDAAHQASLFFKSAVSDPTTGMRRGEFVGMIRYALQRCVHGLLLSVS
jgi:hypothetical protein